MAMETAGNYRWVVLVVILFCALCNYSQVFVVGVYHVALLRHFREKPALTTWVGSLTFGMLGCGAPLAGYVINRWDTRTCVFLSGLLSLTGGVVCFFATRLWVIFIAHGFISGLGYCLSFQSAVVTLGLWFRGRSSGVVGVALSVSSLGILLLGRLTQVFIDLYGLHAAYLLNGAIASHACALSLLVRHAPAEKARRHLRRLARRDVNPCAACLLDFRSLLPACVNLFRQPSLVLVAIALFCQGGGMGLIMIHMPQLFVTRGMDPQGAALCVSLSGVGAAVGRSLLGGLANDFPARKAFLLSTVNGLASFTNFLIPVLTSAEAGMYAFAILSGFYASPTMALAGPVVMEMVAVERIPSAMAFCFFMTGLSNLLLPFLSGIGRNIFINFFMTGSLFAIACVCCALSCLVAHGDRDASGREAHATSGKSKPEEFQITVQSPLVVTQINTEDLTGEASERETLSAGGSSQPEEHQTSVKSPPVVIQIDREIPKGGAEEREVTTAEGTPEPKEFPTSVKSPLSGTRSNMEDLLAEDGGREASAVTSEPEDFETSVESPLLEIHQFDMEDPTGEAGGREATAANGTPRSRKLKTSAKSPL